MKHALYPAVLQVLEQVNRIILGKSEQIREIMIAFIANGHVLLEDIPGVGKTTLALAFSRAMQLDYKRIQFTPDILPSALLEVMEERRVTVDGVTREVSAPFLLIATQNPLGAAGTQGLCDSR